MNSFIRSFIIAAILGGASIATAQSFQETVTSVRKIQMHMGRDFWFAPIQNDPDQAGKYIHLSIAALSNTMAYVEYGGHKDSVKVIQNSIPGSNASASFIVPLSDELQSSGIVEAKGIHVYSKGVDLSVYLYSHSAIGGEGMFCIPTVSLGNDYVVAAYQSGTRGDLPSEFTITAAKDSTVVTITPAANLRQSATYPEGDSNVVYSKGQPFQVTLDRGQAVQYQAVYPEYSDVTGTIINASNPVGVVGGTMSAEISGRTNYLCDMMLPTRGWGKTYYTAISQNEENETCCIVSSVKNQVIYFSNTCGYPGSPVTNPGPAFTFSFVDAHFNGKWYSNAPFQLVQYVNPSPYNYSAAPAEVVINPKEEYTKNVLFQVTEADTALYARNDANIFVNSNDKHVALDGNPFSNNRSLECVGDSSVLLYVASDLQPGTHLVTSDSGVDVYVYGTDSSTYAWAGSLGTGFTNDSIANDTVPPNISFTTDSSCMHVALVDSGTGLAEVITDSESNVNVVLDKNFVSDSGMAQTFIDLCATDPLQTGYLRLTVTDLAGNSSTADITYLHPPIVSAPGFTVQTLGFDTVLINTYKTMPVLTVTDTSTQYPITINNIWTNDPAFNFDERLAANLLPLTLTAGEQHQFSITFAPTQDSFYSGLVNVVSNEISRRVAALTGTGYSIAADVMEQGPAGRAMLFSDGETIRTKLFSDWPQMAHLEIQNILGANIFSGTVENGTIINPGVLAFGVYYYRLTANGKTAMGKILLGQ